MSSRVTADHSRSANGGLGLVLKFRPNRIYSVGYGYFYIVTHWIEMA